MPLVQWLLNLDPVQPAQVAVPSDLASIGIGKNVSLPPSLLAVGVQEIPTLAGKSIDVLAHVKSVNFSTAPHLDRPIGQGSPIIVPTEISAPSPVVSSKTLSSSSMTSKAITSKPSIKRRS